MTEVKIHLEGTDLLSQGEIRSAVRGIYGTVRPTDRRVAERFYSPDDLAGVPEETIRIALGVGNPVRHADLRPGDDVVDLGSGGGIDCLLAGRAVGPTGSVVGVDFLPDMVARAGRAATEVGLPNVRFVEGEIEALPLPDASADVVISNGVVNLSPRKVRALAEAFRVLRPGGRLAIVDLVLEHDLPAEIQTHPAAWAGCLSGALSEVALYKGLRRAGFRDVSLEPLGGFGIAECAMYPLFGEPLLDLLRRLVPPERHDRIAASVLVRARKPAPGEVLPGRSREQAGGLNVDMSLATSALQVHAVRSTQEERTMGDEKNQAAAERLRELYSKGDVATMAQAMDEYMSEDIVEEWPQSGERIRGRANVKKLTEGYGESTGKSPRMTFGRLIGGTDVYVVEGTMDYGDGIPVNYVGIAELSDGKVVKMTEYFANPFEAPAWRAGIVERMDKVPV